MISTILTLEDVKIFARELKKEGVSFHPDDDFNEYVNIKTNISTYTKNDADYRNKLMEDCFQVCEKEGVDIYEVMMKELFSELD